MNSMSARKKPAPKAKAKRPARLPGERDSEYAMRLAQKDMRKLDRAHKAAAKTINEKMSKAQSRKTPPAKTKTTTPTTPTETPDERRERIARETIGMTFKDLARIVRVFHTGIVQGAWMHATDFDRCQRAPCPDMRALLRGRKLATEPGS
jgi:hypothetical protein